MPLVTRTGKGSKLSIAEMDGNLTYLEGLSTPRMLVTALENKETVDIIDALEGNSIPDGSTAEYQKTIPLSFRSPTLLYVAVIYNNVDFSMAINPLDLGITSTGFNFQSGVSTGDSPSRLRFIVTPDYTTTRVAGVLVDTRLQDETGNPMPTMIEAPTYLQNNGTLFGVYVGLGTYGAGYSSSNSMYTQGHSVIKSMYINDDGNLVVLFKKRSSTASETWTRLQFNVYDIS
jgi:hypothetical protein